MQRTISTIAGLALVLSFAARDGHAQAADPHAPHRPAPAGAASASRALPPLPDKLPGWMGNTKRNHIFYKRGRYNFDVYNIGPLAKDLNAVAVGHAMAYEDLVTRKADRLETKTFERIDRVLKNPPRFMPDEAAISPTFGRKYGVLEQVFDWTHILHAQTVDVLASKQMTEAEKDREIERLWKYYFESVPYAITPLPMNMEFLDSQPYSMAFRKKYPKVNGLFWGYHWLQGTMYDALYRAAPEDQRAAYALIGEQYHKTELYRTDRPFMPMFGEVSPVFAARFPHIANAFDNLHMLHDLVNDILATGGMTEKQKEEQVKRAIWMVSADAHRDEKPGATSAEKLHDHRHFVGMPGMGMMRGMTPELMWMEGMGWMSMADCHHCSMPLWEGEDWWRNPTVTADGWSMRVRCPLCARDMAAETKGRAMLRIPTEDPNRVVVVISDEQGNLKTSTPGVVFLENEGSHTGCDEWSRAFSSRAAFDAYVRDNAKLAGAKPLSFDEWAKREGRKPDTYVKPKGPVENPYEQTSAPAAGETK
jgi:hypothetical protein